MILLYVMMLLGLNQELPFRLVSMDLVPNGLDILLRKIPELEIILG